MKNSTFSQNSCKFYNTIPQFLLEMGKITKKQQNIGGGREPWQWGKKTRWLWWNRLWYQKREPVIPPLRTPRRLPDNFTRPPNFSPSISASKGCFKWQLPHPWPHAWKCLDAVFLPSGSCNQLHPELSSRDAQGRQQGLSNEHGGPRAPSFG